MNAEITLDRLNRYFEKHTEKIRPTLRSAPLIGKTVDAMLFDVPGGKTSIAISTVVPLIINASELAVYAGIEALHINPTDLFAIGIAASVVSRVPELILLLTEKWSANAFTLGTYYAQNYEKPVAAQIKSKMYAIASYPFNWGVIIGALFIEKTFSHAINMFTAQALGEMAYGAIHLAEMLKPGSINPGYKDLIKY